MKILLTNPNPEEYSYFDNEAVKVDFGSQNRETPMIEERMEIIARFFEAHSLEREILPYYGMFNQENLVIKTYATDLLEALDEDEIIVVFMISAGKIFVEALKGTLNTNDVSPFNINAGDFDQIIELKKIAQLTGGRVSQKEGKYSLTKIETNCNSSGRVMIDIEIGWRNMIDRVVLTRGLPEDPDAEAGENIIVDFF